MMWDLFYSLINKRIVAFSLVLLFSCINLESKGLEEGLPSKSKGGIRVLYFTGGGFHDYPRQLAYIKKNLTQSIKNVSFHSFWLTKRQATVGKRPTDLVIPKVNLSNYDVLIFNICFGRTTNKEFIKKVNELVLKKPSLLIHCTFHSFRKNPPKDLRKQWVHTLGIDSQSHSKKSKLQLQRKQKNHPVLNFMNKKWYFTNSRDELYTGVSYTKDIKVLANGKIYKSKSSSIPVIWEIKRPKQRAIATTIPHAHEELNSAEFQALLVNSILYLTNKKLPYSQYFTNKHKLLRNDKDKLYTYSSPKLYKSRIQGKTPYKKTFKVPQKAKFFVAQFKALAHKKNNGIFFKFFVDNQFLFHSHDLFTGQKEKIKFKLPEGAKTVKIEVVSLQDYYKTNQKDFFKFQIYDWGFTY